MEPQHIITLLLIYFITASFAAILLLFRGNKSAWVMVLASHAAVFGTVWLSQQIEPGQNVFASLTQAFSSFNRPHCASAALGFAFALPWILQLFFRERIGLLKDGVLFGFSLSGILFLIFGFGSVLAGKEQLSKYFKNPNAPGGGGGVLGSSAEGFEKELILKTEIAPTRIAVDESGRVFVSGQQGVAAQTGCIVELVQDAQTGEWSEKIVATMLNRPYGLAAWKGDLYVSRSGQHTRAINGQLVHESTGAVTRLRDLDGDGIFEFYHDVVTGLPGSRGSDYLHQNADLIFGEDGTLWVTSGANSDHDPLLHEWEGKVLRVSPDFGEVQVHASGFRNVFGLTFGPFGELWCTDNDVNNDPGDELNVIREGQHYGHPYALANEEAGDDFTKPVWTAKVALGGLEYTDSENLPEEYRDCLYVAVTGADNVSRLSLEKKKDGRYEVTAHPFVDIPEAVDITISKDGVFWVTNYYEKEVWRVRYVGKDAP